MEAVELISKTIRQLDNTWIEKIKSMLIGRFVFFSVISPEDATKDILAEKMCDYFETLEAKTNKSFDKEIDGYVSDLDKLVNKKIADVPHSKKKDVSVEVPRARKYYEKARSIKKVKESSFDQLVDYSRIMLCLYMAILENGGEIISDFEFSFDSLDPETIINAMQLESPEILGIKLPKIGNINIKDIKTIDASTFVLAIIMLCFIKSTEVQGVE